MATQPCMRCRDEATDQPRKVQKNLRPPGPRMNQAESASLSYYIYVYIIIAGYDIA